MRSSYRTTAIILDSLDYGESDRILTFYTADFGKLKGIAKGARRSRKRFLNVLEPFSLSHIIFSKKERDTLVLIESCDIINHHPGIREDLDKTLLSSYLVELTDKFTQEGKKDTALFQLLQNFLLMIDTGNHPEEFIRFFEIRLLKLSGYEPVLDHCMQCKEPVSYAVLYRFIPSKGGIKCKTCHQNSFDSFPVSVGTLKSLLLGKEMDIQKINRIGLSDQSAQESRNILSRFIHHLLGKDIKSLQVLNQIRRLGI
jgi:DNA repair protein RecO (recombination protein O)